MKPFILSLALLLVVSPVFGIPKTGAPSAQTEMKLGKIVDQLQKTWDATKSYQTNFKQVVFAKRLGTRDESEGILSVIKPDDLRWESKNDGYLQILKGKKLVTVQENKRRGNRVVDIYKDVTKTVNTRPLAFLAGKAKFREVYGIKLLSESENVAELRLTPKDGSSETYIAEINKSSYLLRSLTTDSTDTRVRIDFSDTKINVALDDKLFDFKPNPNDIVHTQ